MGIQNLNPVVKEILEERNAPSAFFDLPITELRGYRIAVDAANLMCAHMHGAKCRVLEITDLGAEDIDTAAITKEFLSMCLYFVEKLLFHGITPVFVFDGEHPPEKGDTKDKRRQKTLNTRAKIEELRAVMAATPILDRSPQMVVELRKAMSADLHISRTDHELFRRMLKTIGVPCLQAKGDAEQVCSMLCLEEKVAAVYSADTDNLAYGCPLVISRPSKERFYDPQGNSIEMFKCVRIDHVLNGLEMPYKRFLDFCIMAGCDYNTNVRGKGAKKSYALLQTYGSLENLPENIDTTCLDYERCRQIFARVPSESIISGEENESECDSEKPAEPAEISLKLNFRLFFEKGRTFLSENGLNDPHGERIFERYRHMVPGRDGRPLYICHPDSPLASVKIRKQETEVNNTF